MLRRQNGSKPQELLAALRAMFAVAPWTAVALMFILTREQWASLLNGDAHAALRKAVKRRSERALAAYRLRASKYGDDIAHEVLLKLIEGRFLAGYDPARVHPRAYLLGAAYQYARTLTRSWWRGDSRMGPLDE